MIPHGNDSGGPLTDDDGTKVSSSNVNVSPIHSSMLDFVQQGSPNGTTDQRAEAPPAFDNAGPVNGQATSLSQRGRRPWAGRVRGTLQRAGISSLTE